MWHFRSKCQRIRAFIKTSHKQLKIVLALEVRNFGLAFIMPKLGKFPFFHNFFPNLAKAKDLDVFSLFNIPNLDVF